MLLFWSAHILLSICPMVLRDHISDSVPSCLSSWMANLCQEEEVLWELTEVPWLSAAPLPSPPVNPTTWRTLSLHSSSARSPTVVLPLIPIATESGLLGLNSPPWHLGRLRRGKRFLSYFLTVHWRRCFQAPDSLQETKEILPFQTPQLGF